MIFEYSEIFTFLDTIHPIHFRLDLQYGGGCFLSVVFRNINQTRMALLPLLSSSKATVPPYQRDSKSMTKNSENIGSRVSEGQIRLFLNPNFKIPTYKILKMATFFSAFGLFG